MSTQQQTTKDPKPGKVTIYIDGTQYIAGTRELTGAQIRAVANPPIPDDRDLWMDIVDKLDELIPNDKTVELEPNQRFFSVPRVINPGQTTAA